MSNLFLDSCKRGELAMQWFVALVFLCHNVLAWSDPNVPAEGAEVLVYEHTLFQGETLRLTPGA